MPLPFYGVLPDSEHWSQHWQRQRFDDLLAVARDTYLTDRLVEHLPSDGLMLEAGCGVGQYVLCLRERGFRLIGGDFGEAALRIGKAHDPALPLAAMDLRALPLPDCSLSAYVSIGVVEHIEAGPQPILDEAYRVLAPDGRLLLSVPWINLMRRVQAGNLRALAEHQRAVGASFYQYAFDTREVRSFLELAGFQPQHFFPYNPGRGVRGALGIRHRLKCDVQSTVPGAKSAARSTRHHRIAHALLYSPPILAGFSHMILAAATKPRC